MRGDAEEQLIAYAQAVALVAATKAGCNDRWRALDDVSGCLTQIDNALTGLVEKTTLGPKGWLIKDEFDPDPDAWFYTAYEDQAMEYARDGGQVFSLTASRMIPMPERGGYQAGLAAFERGDDFKPDMTKEWKLGWREAQAEEDSNT